MALTACGESKDYANEPRPPATIGISGSISPDRVSMSPKQFGAGPVTITIANLTRQTHKVTVETDELGSDTPGLKQTTSAINPDGTAELKLDLAEGEYTVTVGDGDILDAHLKVGAERESSQDQLLQP